MIGPGYAYTHILCARTRTFIKTPIFTQHKPSQYLEQRIGPGHTNTHYAHIRTHTHTYARGHAQNTYSHTKLFQR